MPYEHFYVRRIALEAGVDAAAQVELALESGAPFALDQLYYGYSVAADGRTALMFATHRRIFAGEDWAGAQVVLPSLVALLGEAPTSGKLRLWQTDGRIVVAAWDNSDGLPAWVLARACTADAERAVRTELLTEIGRRLPGQKWELEEFAGPLAITAGPKGQGIVLQLKAANSGRLLTTSFTAEEMQTLDVRDKAVLAVRRQTMRRDRLLWGAFVAVAAGILIALVLELGLLAGGIALKKQRLVQEKLAGEVAKIETAQNLSARIEEMGLRQLRPLEMIAAVNTVRPTSIQFTRCVTNGLNTLEIEAQTNNASSVGTYETALRGLEPLESMEIRDVRLRDGLTTFQLTVVFKAGALAAASSPATEAGS